MIIGRDSEGRVTGWLETYISEREIVDVQVNGNITNVISPDRTTGKVDSKTFFGKPPLPGAFEPSKK